MFRITQKIRIVNASKNSNRIFRNEETNPFVKDSFKCCSCGCENNFTITPYETGFGFLEIYDEEKVLSKDEIIRNKIAARTSSWAASYLGELTVNDLPTLYFGTSCEKCYSNYIVVFCYGEKQPGLTMLEISGVWNYENESHPASPDK